MANVKKVGVILIGLFVALLFISFFVGTAINLFVPPSEAVYSDSIVEDIGGDNALVATLNGCAEVSRNDIPDGNFKTDLNFNLGWKNAKNISFVDTYANKGYMIVWKDSPKNYPDLSSEKEAKYISDTSSTVIPAALSPEVAQKVREDAVTVYRALGCRGLSRVDFFVTYEGAQVVFNEINTLPGFTSISMYPKLFDASGIGCTALIERLLELAEQE